MVFTNGVFDILHRGHVQYLAQARALGASLAVGLNSDYSARRLGKGADRPVNSELDRAWMLDALESVSAIVLFDDATPWDLLLGMRPDVYVKGGDYSMDEMPEAQLVRSWGGKAMALPYLAGYSTTRLIERLRA